VAVAIEICRCESVPNVFFGSACQRQLGIVQRLASQGHRPNGIDHSAARILSGVVAIACPGQHLVCAVPIEVSAGYPPNVGAVGLGALGESGLVIVIAVEVAVEKPGGWVDGGRLVDVAVAVVVSVVAVLVGGGVDARVVFVAVPGEEHVGCPGARESCGSRRLPPSR